MKRKIPIFILISVLMTLVLTTCASATELKLTARHPWFTAVFAIVGLPMLVWVVVVRRRRQDQVALQTIVGRMINHYVIGFLVYPESLERG